MTEINGRNNSFDKLAQIFRNKATTAKQKSKALSQQVKDPKFGDRKRAHFLQEQKHFKRLADGYNRAARDIMYLKGKDNEVDVATPSPVPELVRYTAELSYDEPNFDVIAFMAENPSGEYGRASEAERIIADLVKENAIEREATAFADNNRTFQMEHAEAAEAKLADIEKQVPVGVFGHGNLVVDTGSYLDVPAVFVWPSPKAGEVGRKVPVELQVNHGESGLVDGAWFMTFPTDSQAKLVSDALCNANPVSDREAETIERLKAEKSAMRKAATDYCWQRYKGRQPMMLKYEAVFTSHEWQKIGEAMDEAVSALSGKEPA